MRRDVGDRAGPPGPPYKARKGRGMTDRQLLAQLRTLCDAARRQGEATLRGWQASISRAVFLPGAANLAHYLGTAQA